MSAERFWKAKAAKSELALLRELSEVAGNLGRKCLTAFLLSACIRHSTNHTSIAFGDLASMSASSDMMATFHTDRAALLVLSASPL